MKPVACNLDGAGPLFLITSALIVCVQNLILIHIPIYMHIYMYVYVYKYTGHTCISYYLLDLLYMGVPKKCIQFGAQNVWS